MQQIRVLSERLALEKKYWKQIRRTLVHAICKPRLNSLLQYPYNKAAILTSDVIYPARCGSMWLLTGPSGHVILLSLSSSSSPSSPWFIISYKVLSCTGLFMYMSVLPYSQHRHFGRTNSRLLCRLCSANCGRWFLLFCALDSTLMWRRVIW